MRYRVTLQRSRLSKALQMPSLKQAWIHRRQSRLIKTLSLLLLITSLSTPQARAEESCQPLINACRATIAQHTKKEQDDAAVISQLEETLKGQEQVANQDAEKLQSWTRNPFYMSALGFFVGMLATGYVLKR